MRMGMASHVWLQGGALPAELWARFGHTAVVCVWPPGKHPQQVLQHTHTHPHFDAASTGSTSPFVVFLCAWVCGIQRVQLACMLTFNKALSWTRPPPHLLPAAPLSTSLAARGPDTGDHCHEWYASEAGTRPAKWGTSGLGRNTRTSHKHSCGAIGAAACEVISCVDGSNEAKHALVTLPISYSTVVVASFGQLYDWQL